MIDKARTARDDYQAALWYDDALRLLDHLINEYPGSSVAVKLTTGQPIGSINMAETIFERDTIRAKLPGLSFKDCRDCPKMLVITGGIFVMGSPDSEPGRWDNEGPVHSVALRYRPTPSASTKRASMIGRRASVMAVATVTSPMIKHGGAGSVRSLILVGTRPPPLRIG